MDTNTSTCPTCIRGLRSAFAAVATTLLVAVSAPASASNLVEREYAEAVQSFRAGRTSEAFGRFMDLANRGDVDSARIALFMHQYGQPLYGKHWDAGPQNVAYWASLVRNSGTSARATGEFAPTVLVPQKPKARLAAAKPATGTTLKKVARTFD
jgi:hypothetical protein